MKYYLVDYENVNASGLDGICELSEDTRVVLFYTKNSNKIDLGVINLIRDMKGELSIIEVHHGKQALDIQLASYLGYLIGTEPESTEYYIISKDKGYLNVQSFWPDRKITLCKNLYDDSVIISEPTTRKKTASSSRGRRKTTAAKAPKEDAKASKADDKPAAKADDKPAAKVDDKPAAKADDKPAAKAADKPAAKADDKPAAKAADKPVAKADEKPAAEEPKPNAFAEAAAIAKAVVEASKARNEADEKAKADNEKAKADAPKKPARKTAAKKAAAKKSDDKKDAPKKDEAAKAEDKKAEQKKAEDKKTDAKKAESKKAEPKKAAPKQRISDTRAEVNNEIQKILSKEGVDGDIVNATASFVSKNIGKDGYKQIVYRGIIKEHGQKQGLAIYRLIKDIL